MPNIVEIIIDGKNQGAIKAIGGVTTEMLAMEKTSRSLSDRLGSMFSSGAIALAASGIAASMAYAIKKQIDFSDELSKTAQRIGMTTENLSTLKFAADLSDVSFENLSTAMQRLSKNMFDVNNGVGQTAKYGFDALGISVTKANGQIKDNNEVLLEVADRFSKMKDGTEKTAIAVTLFGRSGAQMIPMLNAGAKGISELQQKARDLGLELSTNAGRQAEEFNDNLTIMKNIGIGVANQMMMSLLPSLLQIENSILSLTPSVSEFSPMIDILSGAFKGLGTAVYAVVGFVDLLGTGLGVLGATVAKIMTGDFKGAYDVMEQGGAKINNVVYSFGSAIGGLWSTTQKYNDEVKKMQEAADLQKQQQAAAQLQKQWLGVSQTLKRDVMLEGLGPLSKTHIDLMLKINDLKKKYGDVKGALGEINAYYTQIVNKQLQLTAALTEIKPIDNPYKMDKPLKMDMQPLDTTGIMKNMDEVRNSVSSVSADSQLYFEMMNGTAASAFGGMADAASAFYDLSGQKSKELFVLNKAFSIGQAIINTWVGASKALDQGGIFGPIMAATVIASGMAMVAKIASTQPGSTGGSGISYSSASMPVNGIPNTTSANSAPRQVMTTNSVNQGANNSAQNPVTNNYGGDVHIGNITVAAPAGMKGAELDKWVRDELAGSIKKAIKDKALVIN